MHMCRAAAVGILALGSKAAMVVKSAGGGKAALGLIGLAGELVSGHSTCRSTLHIQSLVDRV